MDFNNANFNDLFQHKLAEQHEQTENYLQKKLDQQCGSISIATRQKGSALCHNDTHTEGSFLIQGKESMISKNESKLVMDKSNSQTDINRTDFKFQPHSGIFEGQGQASSQIRDGQYLPLQHCFRKHVKPKKQHEILQLGQVCFDFDL